MIFFYAFLFGGIFCAFGELLILKTKLTPARILVGYVCAGVLLSAVGVYKPFSEFAGAGATVPLLGFGHALADGVRESVDEKGVLGILCGGLRACASGIGAAIFFGFLSSLFFRGRPEGKRKK